MIVLQTSLGIAESNLWIYLTLIAVATAAAIAGVRTLYAAGAMWLLSWRTAFGATSLYEINRCCVEYSSDTPLAILLFINGGVGLILFGAAVVGRGEEASEGMEGPEGIGSGDLPGAGD